MQLVQQMKQFFPGYDFTAVDQNLTATVEIIRFDNINDPRVVMQQLDMFIQNVGAQLQIQDQRQNVINGAQVSSFQGMIMTQQGGSGVGINLVQTRGGIVAVNFSLQNPMMAQQALPVLQQIIGSLRVAQ